MNLGYNTLTWLTKFKEYDLDLVLSEIKQAGYKGIEFIESLDKLGEPESLKNLLKQHKLCGLALCCDLDLNRNNSDIDLVKKRIDYANKIQIPVIVICGGWIKNSSQKTKQNFEIIAEKLRKVSTYAKKYGIEVTYHPHLNTIVETLEDIDNLFDRLEETKLCVDIAHLEAAGVDQFETIEKYRDRLFHVHFKDWDGSRNKFVELGRGELKNKIKSLLQLLKELEYSNWIVVELDETDSTPLESCNISNQFLQRLGVL